MWLILGVKLPGDLIYDRSTSKWGHGVTQPQITHWKASYFTKTNQTHSTVSRSPKTSVLDEKSKTQEA